MLNFAFSFVLPLQSSNFATSFHWLFIHKQQMTNTQQLVDTIIEGIHEKKGRSVVTVNLQNIVTAPCAYFVIATGGSPQQVDAIVDSVEEMTGKNIGEKPTAIAGRQNAEWVAMDYGTVMVHVFLPDARDYYDLENLWDDAELKQFPDVE